MMKNQIYAILIDNDDQKISNHKLEGTYIGTHRLFFEWDGEPEKFTGLLKILVKEKEVASFQIKNLQSREWVDIDLKKLPNNNLIFSTRSLR